MKITIHRGTDQIGGCVTEYEYNGWRLFVDFGEQLPGNAVSGQELEIEGLTKGDASKSALLITHYHGDHLGMIAELPEELPIYMGKVARDIASIYSDHMKSISEKSANVLKRLATVKTFRAGEEFLFGDFKILPVVMDHSAFDAYAFRIHVGFSSVFHTGDFRTHGFRSSKFPLVIDKIVGKVEYVVCEATNVNRPAVSQLTEYELQKRFFNAFKENKYNVVYLSSTNIDRLFALYHAAVRAKRPFYVDAYQRRIMDAVVNNDNIWSKSELFKYKASNPPKTLYERGKDFMINDAFKADLETRGYVLIARAGDKYDRLIEQMPSKGRKHYLSMWKGYLDQSRPAYNPSLARSLGCDFDYMHTSGHCDMEGLENVISKLKPKVIIPIHTDNPQKFSEMFCDKWPVLLLEDGESFSIGGRTQAQIIAYDKLQDPVENSDPNELAWWSLDIKPIGWFSNLKEAEWALQRIVYAPSRVFAYIIDETIDYGKEHRVLYGYDFTILSEYVEGGHEPGGVNFQQDCGLKPGDKVYALHDLEFYDILNPEENLPYDTIIPCEVIGPVTEEYLKSQLKGKEDFVREQTDSDKTVPETSSDYIACFNDWEMDVVLVRPLLAGNESDMDSATIFGIRPTKLYKYEDLTNRKVK